MNAIKNFFQFINDNWTMIIVAIAVIIYVAVKIKNIFNDKDKKYLEIAKTQISQIILRMVAGAEKDYEEIKGAGSIKRSQVIKQIYDSFPVLSRVVEQDAVVVWIDTLIDDALAELHSVIDKNEKIEE